MDDLAGLEELHKTIAEASEQLATFISCGNTCSRQPPDEREGAALQQHLDLRFLRWLGVL